MFLFNKLKFLHKLFNNNLRVYFEGYWEHFTKPKQEYNLRPCILPVPGIHHGYVESLFVYQLIKLLKVLEKCTKNLIGYSRLAFNNHESNIDC